MAREQMEPHVIRTIVTDNGTTVHLCDNFLQDVPQEELEQRRNETRKAAWAIIRRQASEASS